MNPRCRFTRVLRLEILDFTFVQVSVVRLTQIDLVHHNRKWNSTLHFCIYRNLFRVKLPSKVSTVKIETVLSLIAFVDLEEISSPKSIYMVIKAQVSSQDTWFYATVYILMVWSWERCFNLLSTSSGKTNDNHRVITYQYVSWLNHIFRYQVSQ